MAAAGAAALTAGVVAGFHTVAAATVAKGLLAEAAIAVQKSAAAKPVEVQALRMAALPRVGPPWGVPEWTVPRRLVPRPTVLRPIAQQIFIPQSPTANGIPSATRPASQPLQRTLISSLATAQPISVVAALADHHLAAVQTLDGAVAAASEEVGVGVADGAGEVLASDSDSATHTGDQPGLSDGVPSGMTLTGMAHIRGMATTTTRATARTGPTIRPTLRILPSVHRRTIHHPTTTRLEIS
jgi:hypothetical protein